MAPTETVVDPAVISAAADAMEDDEGNPSGKKQRGQTGAVRKPEFEPISAQEVSDGKTDFRKIPVPPHRLSPLKKDWMKIYTPIVEHLKLDIRMNTRSRCVELKTSAHTTDIDTLQKAADFIRAYFLGFEIVDALALLRVEDLFVDTFQVTDVKILKGDHLSRAIGRVAGKDGKCKFAIENATRTRIVLAESRVHILGSFSNIKVARDSICDLIMGSPISKVYTNLRNQTARMGQRI
ncbi:MAG: hypothetical protein SGPRY_014071 [Prymnesium sp.]